MLRRLGGIFSAALLLIGSPSFAAGVQASAAMVVHAPLAQLGPRSPEAERAEALMADGEFEQAVQVLQEGLAEPEQSDDALVELYRLLGLAQLYLGNEEKARDAYEKLLQARPDYDLPRSAPPKIRDLYARIKEDIRKRRVRPVTLTAELIDQHQGGEPLVYSAHVENLALGARLKLYFRRAGAQSYSSVDFARQKGSRQDFEATIPAYELPAENRTYDVEYYLEVADAAQRRLAGNGDAFNPHRLQVLPLLDADALPDEGERPWYKSPWLWVAGGVLAAGAATAIVVVATSHPTGDVPVQIRVQP